MLSLLVSFTCVSRSFREYEVCSEGKFVIDWSWSFVSSHFSFFSDEPLSLSRKGKSVDVGLRRDFTVSNWKFEGLSFHVFEWKKRGSVWIEGGVLQHTSPTSSWREDKCLFYLLYMIDDQQVCSIISSWWINRSVTHFCPVCWICWWMWIDYLNSMNEFIPYCLKLMNDSFVLMMNGVRSNDIHVYLLTYWTSHRYTVNIIPPYDSSIAWDRIVEWSFVPFRCSAFFPLPSTYLIIIVE